MEYISYVLAADALALLVRLVFPGALHRQVLQSYLALNGGFAAVVLFTDSAFFTRVLVGFQIISVAMIVYSIVCLALTLRERQIKNTLAFLGIFLFALFIVIDILSRYGVRIAGQTVSSATGMVLFVFCYAMVLSIEQAGINARKETIFSLPALEFR